MFTLFGTRGSGSAMVEVALQLAQAEFRIVDAASWEESAGLEELKKINPLAQIPTLVLPDGSVLTESAAILMHLGLEYPASGLLPQQASARAQALRGLVYIAANCYAAIGIVDFPQRWCTKANEDEQQRIIAGSKQRLHHLWDVFADTFPANLLLDGMHPSALGLMATIVSRWSGSRVHLATSRPAFSALLLRLEQDPQLAAVMQRHWPAQA
ncbi:glutathione S-transferase family protein [Undibacterium terreum]|uniref:Glutathione S-transferase n=1 Tax=Undibacterium terreum TaxID=1224302 RepID=A0A916XQ27_9BURK|nr:glutathione S-transferase [Undibacterium terreum]GGC94740.1 glutathione S-transferase [Undibacterium terreum]